MQHDEVTVLVASQSQANRQCKLEVMRDLKVADEEV